MLFIQKSLHGPYTGLPVFLRLNPPKVVEYGFEKGHQGFPDSLAQLQ